MIRTVRIHPGRLFRQIDQYPLCQPDDQRQEGERVLISLRALIAFGFNFMLLVVVTTLHHHRGKGQHQSYRSTARGRGWCSTIRDPEEFTSPSPECSWRPWRRENSSPCAPGLAPGLRPPRFTLAWAQAPTTTSTRRPGKPGSSLCGALGIGAHLGHLHNRSASQNSPGNRLGSPPWPSGSWILTARPGLADDLLVVKASESELVVRLGRVPSAPKMASS